MAAKVILGLCTSGSRLKLAASAGGKVFSAQKKVFNQELALFPMARALLARAGSDLRSVNTVCSVRGPGRFTGIRISLTLAGALKAMAGAEVYTATLFEILALGAADTPQFRAWAKATGGARLAVLVHAFKDEYFCQLFNAGGKLKAPRPEGDPVWLKSEDLRAMLAGLAGPLYAAADAEEDPGIYGLLPAGVPKAPPAVSKIIPALVIKACLAYKNRTLRPLYLKPAKYELENNISYGRK